MSIKPTVLQLSDPRVRAALEDFPTMQRWEVLKRCGTAMSIAEFAAACFISNAQAVASLDLLLEAGFVVRQRAGIRCRHQTYRVSSDEVMVVWDRGDAEQRRWIDGQRQSVRHHCRAMLDERATSARPFGASRIYSESYSAPSLTQSEAKRIFDIIQRAKLAIDEIEREALARTYGASVAGEGASQPAEDACPYILMVNFSAIGRDKLPLPRVAFIDSSLVDERCRQFASNPKLVLTARELEVAERLARGESRPEVARSLRVSPNTVASTSKRIYAKLGVRNRAEFATRMKECAPSRAPAAAVTATPAPRSPQRLPP